MNPKAGHVTLQSNLYRPSSFRPEWHGVSLTPIMKPKSNSLPGHRFLRPHPPTEEHMSPITVLLCQHTGLLKIKAEFQTMLLALYLSGHSCASYVQYPFKIKVHKDMCLTLGVSDSCQC